MRVSHLLTGLAALLLAAIAHAGDVIKIGATPGATADAVAALIPEAKAQGLDLRLVEFTDWTLPNEAVNNGDIDLNFFQHQAFLNNAIKERGYKLEFVGLGLLQNIGIYSSRHKRLADVPNKAKVAVANDPVNQGRGLLLLQKAGLIKLRRGEAVGATVHDVIENPKQLQFFEIEGPQLIRSLDDLDLVVVWPSYFFNAGKKEQASQALLYSGIADTFYAMGFVARSDKAKDAKIAKFVSLFQNSARVREVIASRFNNDAKLYTLPWLQK
ncbi:MetQ/NlpA family ABC transporter substrate-binding protein [Hylemonella gracilis]|uniref:D-methionine binding lipoprotein, ABC-type metal ion transport system n=1 Tax=Hylemonella gracilis ATCC 19624 TaxID=887062 RepID=F3KR18_9BURK|nr:MetQ/NlpA family ABC transporter substrate-binding protein [Hylemonella gracilis]EGI77719.1 d-methionine binding lipoprotein, ABC-type metal ion transport system [Hylemonella gracilis ATCC 19624]